MSISSKTARELEDRLGHFSEIYCSGLFFSARWFVLSSVMKSGLHMVVLPDKESAEYCTSDFYNLIEGDRVFFLPDSGKNLERSNYKSSLGVQRTSALGKIVDYSDEKDGLVVVVTYPSAISEAVPDTERIRDSVLRLRKGDEISHERIVETLFTEGFERVDFVSAPGQFAVRGGIIDIFSYSFNNPFRISFFGDEIENINVFDCNTQLSVHEADSAEIYPDLFSEEGQEETFIYDRLPEGCTVWLDSSDMYSGQPFFTALQAFRHVFIDTPLSSQNNDVLRFSIAPQPSFNKNFELLTADIREKIETGYKVCIYGEKESQLDRLRSIFVQNGGIQPDFCPGKNIHSGFIDNEDRVCCYSDHEIFDRFHRVSIRRAVEKSEQLTINDLTSFNIGDYVVHIDYGIGIFGGLVRMRDDKGRVHEVVKLTYKDNDTVFVSVHALHKISRYRSKDSEPPKINKLGSKTWQNLKTSTKSKVKDIAKELIQLYAKRKAAKGFAFSPDSYLQQELESSFMYEDTPDQEKAVKAVKRDMEDDCPMDRLVCGDVGFGKTEVAIRAAFKAVADSKQVAVLVPTTILALQHYNTFMNRLKDFPCNIDYVSRLRTAKEVADIRERLKKGTLDIVIGTHKMLGKGFEFRDLGLLIIDEEQKFGVSAKEKLKQMKLSVDTLTLTATPIPRTLQFSLLGARDLSIINTPPPNRIPIQTEIMLFDDDEVRGIINYELNRGGQIFFVHNRVEELSGINDILHRLVPDMKICVAHGQMEPKVLENKILDFMAGDYDMLLCTTIIENGLDVPNANTIIINQAQNIGLSDLHQLRGRVGRSNKKAFCYLIVPPLTSITDDARRRLKAIEAFSDLGSGFNIAMQDLDIRGAGNLLGAEQSGFISDMGLETYQKILSEAMEELGVETGISSGRSDDIQVSDCTIETDQEALIPDSYISMTSEKIRIYKELDSLPDDRSIDRMKDKMNDRFGKMPEETGRLFDIVKIRHLAERLGFEKVIIKNGLLIAFFISNPMSKYYRSRKFADILDAVNRNAPLFELKQNDERLRVLVRNVPSIEKAYSVLKKLG
ncbi:MAG: transcription-repair coupling factor [Bacteroidetes bacterium]|uniref:Transcription-repair-coupling factor n=1 Tax=Candidatus Cryptobacteroides merdavium TaxID=2840769 RepID=A0A9D9EC79_9BACT|nr:transcription-repair coupling factor [Candidatus Cryptobacteroides merdavium]